jgi:hypothetical protein
MNETTEFEDVKWTEDYSTYAEHNGQYEETLKVLEMEKKKLAYVENLT